MGVTQAKLVVTTPKITQSACKPCQKPLSLCPQQECVPTCHKQTLLPAGPPNTLLPSHPIHPWHKYMKMQTHCPKYLQHIPQPIPSAISNNCCCCGYSRGLMLSPRLFSTTALLPKPQHAQEHKHCRCKGSEQTIHTGACHLHGQYCILV